MIQVKPSLKKLPKQTMPSLVSFSFGSSGFISQASNLSKQGLTACRTFSLEELVDATKNFDISTFLGENSYGKVKHDKFSWN